MSTTMYWSHRVALVALLLLVPFNTHAAEKLPWEQIASEEGITVWKQSVPGTSFVAFRGRGIVDADIYDVFSVLYDVDNKTDLMANCVDYRLLKYKSAGKVIVYNHIGSPFFLISDRDSVIETQVIFEPEKKQIVANFFKGDDKLLPPRSGIVRTKALEGKWVLRATEDGKTDLTYQAVADPGGLLPSWLVNLASRKLPYRTIKNMRVQVKQTETYAKSRLWVKYLFDFKGLLGEDHAVFRRTPEEEAEFMADLDAVKKGQKAKATKPSP